MPHKTWIHKCDKNNDAETVLGVEVCSDCGQRGRFDGWQLSMIEMMAAYQHRTDLRSIGPHRAMTDELLVSHMKVCDQCKGRGVIDLNNGEGFEICPRCNLAGSIFDGSPEEFQAIRQQIISVYPFADPDVPLTDEARQAFNAGGGFMGGGFFRPRPKDKSLRAYKDWSNNMLAATSPNFGDKKPMTDAQWKKSWKEFWSEMDDASGQQKTKDNSHSSDSNENT